MANDVRPVEATSARVLVVDDDDEVRAMVAAALKTDGHAVFEARSGLEALSCVRSLMLAGMGAPEVIVTDIRMPGASGRALISGLRMGGCMSPIVVMTAYGAKALGEDGQTPPGATAIFDKPFDVNDLRKMVSSLVVKSDHHAASRR